MGAAVDEVLDVRLDHAVQVQPQHLVGLQVVGLDHLLMTWQTTGDTGVREWNPDLSLVKSGAS